VWIRRFGLNRAGNGRAIALWRFIAVQHLRADADIDLCRKVLIAEMALMEYSMQLALPDRITFPATREARLVQIAESLSDDSKRFMSDNVTFCKVQV
jgi:hypothetical protein